MKSADYWRKRAEMLIDYELTKSEAYVQKLQDEFGRASNRVQVDILAWYQRFADNNDISLMEAKRLLTAGELKEFHWTVQDYIKAGEEHGVSGAWAKELENASARYHISRLEALQLEIQQEAELLYGNQLDGLDGLLRDIYSDCYHHTAFDVQRGIGIGWSFQTLDDALLQKVIASPWPSDGRSFRDRCWTNKAILVQELRTDLAQSIVRGRSPMETADAIAKRFEVSRYKAGRLAMTESAYFSSTAQSDSFKALGVEGFEVVGTLDGLTCGVCGDMDGLHYPMKDFEAGVTAPPFHPNCRCCTAPYFADDDGVRIAKGDGDRRYYVPQDATFKKWKAETDSRAEQSQYERMSAVLQKDAPKSLDEFRGMRYNDPEKLGYLELDLSLRSHLLQNGDLALPNSEQAVAADDKFIKYLFNPENKTGFAKGRAFASRLGYSADNWEELKKEILARAPLYPAKHKESTKYGEKYEQQLILYGLKGKPAKVVAAWMCKGDRTWMTSCYIKEVKT